MKHFGTSPDLADLEAIAREALASIPPELRRYARDLVVRVEEFPDDDTIDQMELDSPFDLLGLYQGVDLHRKSIAVSSETIDTILLYRRPILDYWCETGEDLAHLVRHVLIHEIGHHFGFSDEDMERVEQDD